ncbi:helix-turn-helix transcriptional regulator [Thermanaerothrix sp.]|uniref:helix-turn-helix transcriptional regulator n=1 Tax=Thermanaerothrix sp. TaxID=2972675 RepID=UPI003C7D214C
MAENFEMDELGERIRILLAAQNKSITELAEFTGISRPTIYRIMDGKSEIKLKDAIKISSFFQVPLEVLFGLEESSLKRNNQPDYYGLTPGNETPALQKIYKKLAQKELAKILKHAARILEEEAERR